MHGNLYDGATLEDALARTEHLTAVIPKQAAVGKGFRGALHHPLGVEVLVCGTRKLTQALKRWLKRRSANH